MELKFLAKEKKIIGKLNKIGTMLDMSMLLRRKSKVGKGLCNVWDGRRLTFQVLWLREDCGGDFSVKI